VLDHEVRAYLAAGMDACVAKPIELGELLATLDAVLSAARGASAVAYRVTGGCS
jgi:DNA-binding response OmpR family regulator